MSTEKARALEGPVTVVARTPSFLERYDAKFGIPSQKFMRHIMRATMAGCPWNSLAWFVAYRENRAKARGLTLRNFEVYSLEDYRKFSDGTMGAPMPAVVSDHIEAVRGEFPDVTVRVHAHPWDDPIVEYVDEQSGEHLFGIAWRRDVGRNYTIYPESRRRIGRLFG